MSKGERMKNLWHIFTAIAIILVASGCATTGGLGRTARASFNSVLDASKAEVAFSKEDESWVLASPVGDEALFSTNFARNASGMSGMADMDKPDVEFTFSASPFIAAGLDVEKLPVVDGIKYEIENGRFMLHFELGNDRFAPDAAKSFEATFAEIVRTQSSRIGYYKDLDHYGIQLGNGNMFEWAKDIAKNDKDIIWVLNPEPFIAAGVDPGKIQGWIFAKVRTTDATGETIFVDKLLKPFNIK